MRERLNMVTKEALKSLLDQYDVAPLECDGLTRVLHTILARAGIAHLVRVGRLLYTVEPKEINPHLWIEVETYLIDYRARMWLGNDETIPHGIVEPEQYPQVEYTGEAIDFPILSDGVLRAMIQPLPPGLDALYQSVQGIPNQSH